jgi:stage II sporulation protein Q
MREEEKQKKSVRPLKTKWYKQKRWVYPAVYIGFAAVVLAAVLWYQNDVNEEVQPSPGVSDLPSAHEDQEAVPANNAEEVLKMPVAEESAVSIQTKFYDKKASAEEQQAAIVVINNQFFQSTGIDLVAKEEGETFDITASLSGKVVKAEKDPLLGYVVVLEHADGVTTQYSSLNSVQVEVGDTVKQGALLGQAGLAEYNKDAGVHAHFEVRKNGTPVNPSEYFGQMVTAIPDITQVEEETQETSTEDGTETPASTEDETETPTSTEDETETEESSTEPAGDQSEGTSRFEDNGTENHA